MKSFFANCLIIALLAAYLYGIIWYVDGLSQKSVATQFMFTPGFGLLHLFVISAFVAFSAMQVFELRRSTGAIGVVAWLVWLAAMWPYLVIIVPLNIFAGLYIGLRAALTFLFIRGIQRVLPQISVLRIVGVLLASWAFFAMS